MDHSRSLTFITRVGAVLTVVGSCITPFTDIPGKLEGLFSKVVPAEMAPTLALSAMLLILVGSILAAWLSFRKVSRLNPSQKDAFDLRARTADDLIGRDGDITDFMALIQTNQLVFLVGDSGSGKSALVATGLKPLLQKGDQFLPILITRYGTDWVTGPTIEALKVLREACSPEQQKAVEWSQPHKLNDATPAFLGKKLRAISTALNRTPVLMFDQFDDYQAQHRTRFSQEHRRWISADELRAMNPFWDVIARAIDDGCHVLIVTRRDTADGLHAVRFTNNAVQRPLDWVSGNRLDDLLERIAPPAAATPVVIDREHGWVQLWPLLARDMYRDGAFLPQQVRTVLLGLRTLPALTPQHYRASGAAAGMGALYVGDAISSISRLTKQPQPAIRKLLLGMVDRGPDGRELKTRRMTATEITLLFPDQAQLQTVLEALAERELVRAVPNADTGENDWQLDHDYLARAVVAEERIKERQVVLLREGGAALAHAVGDWRQQWRALLPITQWPGLLFSRLRGDFRFGPYRRYAVISLLRVVPALTIVLVIVVASVMTVDELRQRNEATAIFDLLRNDGDDGEGAQANLQLWTAPEPVRHRVETMLLSSRRLTDVSPTWVLAVAGANPREVRRLALVLLGRLASSQKLDERRALWQALSTLAPRLDAATANNSVPAVVQFLANAAEGEREAIRDYLNNVVHNLNPEAANQVVPVVVRSVIVDENSNFLRIIRKLKPEAARAVAARSVSRLASGQERVFWISVLSELGGNLAPEVAMEAIPQLGNVLRSGGADAERSAAAAALLSISNHGTPAVASAAAQELSKQFEQATDNQQRGHIVDALNNLRKPILPQLGMDMAPLLGQHFNMVVSTQQSKGILRLLGTLADHSEAQVADAAGRVLRQISAKVATPEQTINLVRDVPQAIRFVKPELVNEASQKVANSILDGAEAAFTINSGFVDFKLLQYYIDIAPQEKSKKLAFHLIGQLSLNKPLAYLQSIIIINSASWAGQASNKQEKEDFVGILDYIIESSMYFDSYISTVPDLRLKSQYQRFIRSYVKSIDNEHSVMAVAYLQSRFMNETNILANINVAKLIGAFVQHVEMNVADDVVRILLTHLADTGDIQVRVSITKVMGVFASRVSPDPLTAMEGVLRKRLEVATDPDERSEVAGALGLVARRLPAKAAEGVALALRKPLTDAAKSADERVALIDALVDTTEVRARDVAGQAGVVNDLLLVLSDPFASEDVYQKSYQVVGTLPDMALPADWPSAVEALHKLREKPVGTQLALANASPH